MADYPDYTNVMQIIGSDIMVPFDIQAAYIMMPIDIQAQYMNLKIDIAAQTIGNIGIDIKAASVEKINVDITTQSIGNLVIDIEAQSVGIYLKADWEVLAGHDLNLDGTAACADGNLVVVLDHLVENCTAFYICQWGFNVDGNTGVKAVLFYTSDAVNTMLAESGGQVGNSQPFSKPIAIVVGDKIRVSLQQWSGAEIDGHASVGGYWI